MKRVFLVIPVGLISVAAVGAGLFFQPRSVEISTPQNLPPAPSLLKGESTEILSDKIKLPNLDQSQITADDLKQFEVDSDQDGLTDFAENFYQTDPNRADSDGDGYKDGEEVEGGYNPNGEGQLQPISNF